MANEAELREKYINAMRAVANTVSVVTTDGTAGRHGATVSAFCSVSADPPMLLICLNAESRAAKFVSDNQSFCLNVLHEGSDATAKRFAGLEDNIYPNRFEGIAIEETREGPPIIHGATSFQCELASTSQSGSHIIFIGNVIATRKNDAPPLIYHEGNYQKLAKLNSSDDGASKILSFEERLHGRT